MLDSDQMTRRGLVLWTGVHLDVDQAVDFAVAAEDAGWDGVFVTDELAGGSLDPWTVLTAIAMRTERVRLGTWVAPVPLHQPWRLAHIVAALDRLSNGRVMLGTGLGSPQEHGTFGGTYDPPALGRKYDEALEIITGLWSGEPYSFSGEFFSIDNALPSPTPLQQPRVPIVMGCWWPNKKPFRRAARWDGIMPFWPSLMGDNPGPQGEVATGTVEEELREMLSFYHNLTDDPGEIVLPDRDDDGYRELCRELGATWLLATHVRELAAVSDGPQGTA